MDVGPDLGTTYNDVLAPHVRTAFCTACTACTACTVRTTCFPCLVWQCVPHASPSIHIHTSHAVNATVNRPLSPHLAVPHNQNCTARIALYRRTAVLQDVALYGVLCALATFDRSDLQKRLIANIGFKEFLELVPEVQFLFGSFCRFLIVILC